MVEELAYGVEMVGREDEKRRVRNACRLYPVVGIDAEIARRAGRLLAGADRNAGGPGQAGVDGVDAMVAAVSEHLGDPGLTDNVRDSEALGVAVERLR